MTADLDKIAVREVLDGRIDAFEEIVQRWQRPMIHLAYRFCRDAAMAEDLAQEAFLKVFRSLKQWRGEGRFSTWLFAVATNVYRSKLRRKRLPKAPLETIGEIAAARRTEDELEESERARLLRTAVLGLPDRYRDAITLYYFHDMSVGEAALSLGLSEGTVKSHLFRGRKMLEAHLEDLLRPSEDHEETT